MSPVFFSLRTNFWFWASFCLWEVTEISPSILSHLSESSGFTHPPLPFVSQTERPDVLHRGAFLYSLIKLQFFFLKFSVASVEKVFPKINVRKYNNALMSAWIKWENEGRKNLGWFCFVYLFVWFCFVFKDLMPHELYMNSCIPCILKKTKQANTINCKPKQASKQTQVNYYSDHLCIYFNNEKVTFYITFFFLLHSPIS